MLEAVGARTVGQLLDRLPMDEAVRVLTDKVPDRQRELLAAMSTPNATNALSLLGYPPGSAGRLMTEQFARIDAASTAADALAGLRETAAAVETLTDLYSVDRGGRLQGVLSLQELVLAAPDSLIADLLTTEVVSVAPDTSQQDLARLVSRYDFLAMPVVDESHHMLGLVPVDDVIDVLVAESGKDLLRLGSAEGGGVLNQPYFSVPILRVVRKRFFWLLLLFVAETATGTVLRAFDTELAQVVALSFFIPLLIGTGGNTGAQTVSTLIRGLALAEIHLRDTWRVIRREVVSGLCLGLMLGTVGFFRALLWHSGVDLSLVVGITLVAVCTWANTIGALIPLVASRFHVDPALVSAPLITTLVDATGLAIYLLVAKVILGL